MKQSILPFCIVLALLGAAYVFKNQWSPPQAPSDGAPEAEAVSQRKSSVEVKENLPISGEKKGISEQKKKDSVKPPQADSAIKPPEYGLVSLPAQKEKPGVYAKPTLDVAYWKKVYAGEPVNARKWSDAWQKGIHTGWFSGKDEKVATGYITTWGPLGLRTYMHDRTWAGESAFLARAPGILKDTSGALFANSFEVIDVLPGSPAEGHLKPGDLMMAMGGKSFTSATKLKLNPPHKHQGSRSLALHAGLLLDAAEGRGRVELKVLRGAKLASQPSGEWKMVASQKFSHHGNKPPHHFEMKVKGGYEIRLRVTDGGNGNGSDGFWWENVFLKGGEKSIPLRDIEMERFQVGYGKLKENLENSSWEAHAHSEIDFKVPVGEWTLVADAKPRNGATVEAQILTRRTPTVPKALLSQVKTITFPIAKMGTFKKTMPTGCVKTANIIAQQSAWLATQQMPDGSWQRPQGYTSNFYDTAWAGLGLMATGDKEFDPNIQKAARFLAFDAKTDGWALPASCVVIFLSEYWFRYQDDTILPGLRAWVDCLLTESMTGDYTVGHGHNPGYRGTGVSTGGAHVALALVMAEKTPVGADKGIIDRMLFRVQELAPDGFVPYGRGRGTAEFKPHLEGAGTYSGRHGPYLTASLIHGGPLHFTENCAAIYRDGPRGGCDQGHATETLSSQWAFIAMAASDLPSYREHLDALRWKITMRRAFNGGFCSSAFRLEYAGGESLLDYAIRSGSWLVALCAEKQNLAITGAPQYRAKQLVDLPPTQDSDAMLHGYYLRNWGVVDAVLGERSSASLKAALRELRTMKRGEKLGESMHEFLTSRAMPVARELMAMSGLPSLQRAYLAELVLGVDHRIDFLDEEKTPNTNDFLVKITSQHPMAGLGLTPEKLAERGLVMKGSVRILKADGLKDDSSPMIFDSALKVIGRGWRSSESTSVVMAKTSVPFEAVAHVDYQIGNLQITYDRPVFFNQGEDWGNGEKQRKVVNDRRVWVPGTLYQDQARWNISFLLPSGQFVAAATQGNDIMVRDKRGDWVSPRDHSLQKGSAGEFCYTSGWQHYECRVPEFRLKSEPSIVAIASMTQSGKPLAGADAVIAGRPSAEPLVEDGVLTVNLERETALRAIDFRTTKNKVSGLVVEALVDGKWQIIHLGRPIDLIKQLKPVTSKQLRITMKGVKKGAELTLLRIYQS